MANTFVWYNLELRARLKDEFIKRMPQFDLDRCLDIANHGDIEEFRLLCNIVSTGTYDLSYFNHDHDSWSRLKNACNSRVNAVLGKDVSALYNYTLRYQQHDEWADDERYTLFTYNVSAICRYVILSVVSILHYMNQPKSIENAINMHDAFHKFCIPSLYNERYEYNYDIDPTIRNLDRMHHVDCWVKFANFIWDKDYESAYSMIEEYNESLAI